MYSGTQCGLSQSTSLPYSEPLLGTQGMIWSLESNKGLENFLPATLSPHSLFQAQ